MTQGVYIKSAEHRAKLSAAMRGKKKTSEHKARISRSVAAYWETGETRKVRSKKDDRRKTEGRSPANAK